MGNFLNIFPIVAKLGWLPCLQLCRAATLHSPKGHDISDSFQYKQLLNRHLCEKQEPMAFPPEVEVAPQLEKKRDRGSLLDGLAPDSALYMSLIVLPSTDRAFISEYQFDEY